MLLAAAVPARPGERVLEGGTGSGAALLCLAARVPGLRGLGIERDPGMAALARANMAANGFDGLAVLEGDLTGWRRLSLVRTARSTTRWPTPPGMAPAPPRRSRCGRRRSGERPD